MDPESPEEWILIDLPDKDHIDHSAQTQPTQPPRNLQDALYRPLDFPRWETRFIKLHDVKSDGFYSDPISCELFYASLIDTSKDYVALSYCWGNHSDTRPILVNGVVRRVTANLEAALKALRHGGIQLVWIDAICINQSDNYERSHQVSRMGSIYSQASKIVVWLGNAANDSSDAMRLLSKFSSHRVADDMHYISANAQHSIADLLARPYWNRVWIVQELAKASNIEVWCGEEKLDWMTFVASCKKYKTWIGGALNFAKIDDLQHFRQMEQRSNRGAPRMLLSEALIRTRYARATDLRDKVYAMLALSRDGPQVVPTPNYAQEPVEVFKAASRNMIVTQGQTALILLAGRRPFPYHSPSWIPLWVSQDKPLPTWIVDCINKHETQFEPRTLAKGDRLSVPAFMLETITANATSESLLDTMSTKSRIESTSDSTPVLCEISAFLLSCTDSQDIPSHQVEVTRAHCLAALWLDTGPTAVPWSLRRLKAWYNEHKTWLVQSRPVSEWVEEHSRFSLQASWYSQRIHNGSGSNKCIDLLKPLEASLALMEEHDLHTVIADRTDFQKSLRMAHKASVPGDSIFRLENCALPVVLRPCLEGHFTLIGEALGRRDGKNNNWQGHIGWEESEFKKWSTITIV